METEAADSASGRRRLPESRAELTHRIPIGGLGTGYIEFGKDGWFRNITINNNRTRESAIPAAPHAWLAVRTASEGRSEVRLLRRAMKDEVSPEFPARANEDSLFWRSLYPTIDYSYQEKEFPLKVTWSIFAPVIPFDYDASTMPALFISVRLQNTSAVPQEAAAMLNWQNIIGCSGSAPAESLAPIQPILIEREDTAALIIPDRKPKTRDEAQPEPKQPEKPPARFNGLQFGTPVSECGACDHCLALSPLHDFDTSVLSWNPESDADWHEVWEQFSRHGNLNRVLTSTEEPRAGALCAGMVLPPGGQQRLDFVLTWHCPRFELGGVDLGNGYTNRFPNAVEVARTALKHVEYYFRSVMGWQRLLRESSLPKWLSKMLVTTCSIFTTNMLYTRDGRVLTLRNAETLELVPQEERIYASFALLLFFQRFEESELSHFVEAVDTEDRTRLCSGFRIDGGVVPEFDLSGDRQPLLAAQMLLSALRNFAWTGNLARLQALYPRLQEVVHLVQRRLRPGEGLPQLDWRTLRDGLVVEGMDAYAGGLWIAGLAAYAQIARQLRDPDEAQRADELRDLATRQYERLLWDKQGGYYRLFAGSEGAEPMRVADVCHVGQLAGQWYADLLGLGVLFNTGHVQRALETMEKFNERSNGLLNAAYADDSPVQNPAGMPAAEAHYSWPGLQFGHYVSLQIHWNQVERGFRILEKYHRNVQYKHELLYDAPEKWDLRLNAPAGPVRDANVLSMWYVLYALQGLEFHVAERRLRAMPRLPYGTHSLEWPVFLPVCLGQMKFQQETSIRYRQRLRIHFDSPLSINTIVLRLPERTGEIEVACETQEGHVPVVFEKQKLKGHQVLTVRPDRPLVGVTVIAVSVRETKPEASPEPSRRA